MYAPFSRYQRCFAQMVHKNFAHRAHALACLLAKNYPFVLRTRKTDEPTGGNLKQALTRPPARRPIRPPLPSSFHPSFPRIRQHNNIASFGYPTQPMRPRQPLTYVEYAEIWIHYLNDPRKVGSPQPSSNLYGPLSCLWAPMKRYLYWVCAT